MYKIGVVGDKDSVLGFTALGLSVHCCETPEEARRALAAMEDFGVVYITEPLLAGLSDLALAWRDRLTPALIPIPSSRGSLGLGMANVKRNIERAVGADIIGEA